MGTRRTTCFELLAVALATLAVHGATATNFFYTHDGWNDVLLGETVLAGGLRWTENVFRILPTLSFGPRALFGIDMVAWHLPSLLFHALNAWLVLLLTRRTGAGVWAARLAGGLFAVSPLLCHPVEWVGGTYDLFATAGILGATLAFAGGRSWLAAVCGLFALLSKETGVVTVLVVPLVAFAVEGRPVSYARFARRLAPLASVTLACVAFRMLQIAAAPSGAMAGRSIQLDPVGFFTTAPAAVGLAAAGSLVEVAELRDPSSAAPFGFAVFALLAVLAFVLGRWSLAQRPNVAWRCAWLAAAGAIALLPVSLIAMGLPEMAENSRYLYTTAALTAPCAPLLLWWRQGTANAIGSALLFGVAAYGGGERVARSLEQTEAVRPVAEAVLALPAGSTVFVLSDLYDEPTARFLMSRWLFKQRHVLARYVMRGTWVAYARSFGVGEDTALSYFGPRQDRFSPEDVRPGDTVLLQSPATRAVSLAAQLVRRPTGRWEEVPGLFSALPRPDPDDPPIRIDDGRRLHMDVYLGPIASAELAPLAATPVPEGPVTGVALDVRFRSEARPRYGSGYHERFGMLMVGEVRVAFELPTSRGEPHTVSIDLSFDPMAGREVAALGILPCNYPGELTIERVRVRR